MSDFWNVALGSVSFCGCCGRRAVHFNLHSLQLGQGIWKIQLIFSPILRHPFLTHNTPAIKPQMGIGKFFLHFPLQLYVCILLITGSASSAFTTRTDNSYLEGLSWGRKKSFLFCWHEGLTSLCVPFSPWVEFRISYLNFHCSTGLKVQVCGLLILISTSWAWICGNTAKGSLNTWHVCVQVSWWLVACTL